MPELPEVETVCRGLSPLVSGLSIFGAKAHTKQLRIPMPRALGSKLCGQKIIKVERKAKYILIYLQDWILIIHLGMSGRLVFHPQKRPKRIKHDHLVIDFDSGAELVLNDPRKFGLVELIKEKELEGFRLFGKLGIEPFSEDFNAEALYEIFKKRKKNIKATLMDSSLIVGVGNIYASEILFESGISPKRLSYKITKKEAEKICNYTRSVLGRAINAGGSSLRDYKKADGEYGGFQYHFKVYDREDEDCNSCNRQIVRIKQQGRSTFYCKNCQS